MTEEGDRGRPRPTASRGRRKCPICGRPTSPDTHPFCSRRCADIDLNRWLSGVYAIPGKTDDDENRTDDE